MYTSPSSKSIEIWLVLKIDAYTLCVVKNSMRIRMTFAYTSPFFVYESILRKIKTKSIRISPVLKHDPRINIVDLRVKTGDLGEVAQAKIRLFGNYDFKDKVGLQTE